MRTASKTLSHNWRGFGQAAGAASVIGVAVGGSPTIYGPGTDATPTGWCGAVNPLPADMELGTHELTLTNVVVGSRISIRDKDGTVTKYDQIAATSTVVITLNVYGVASLNDWRIKVRKASGSPTYIPYETLMTATPGISSIYVSQIPDE
jgi:hypothetical protein